jgi:hypothetical protein
MKKTSKPNPLKVFNDNKANAVKKAGATMSAFKKSLPKAQNGIVAGPQTEAQSILSNYVNSQPPIPRPNKSLSDPIMGQMMVSKQYPWEKANVKLTEPRPNFMEPTDPLKEKKFDQNKIDALNKKYPNGIPGPSSIKKNKKGGAVKTKKK